METGMAEKSSWDQANRWQNLGLVWRNRKKISQIINACLYLPFFLLIILWWCTLINHRLLAGDIKHTIGHGVKYGVRSPKLFGIHVHSCSYWLRPAAPPPPHPPHLGSYTRALLISSQDDISLWPPAIDKALRISSYMQWGERTDC